MLRKFAYNKMFRTTGMLILLIMLLLFPAKKKYSLNNENTIFSSANDKNEIYLIDKNNYISRTYINMKKNNNNEYAKDIIELLVTDGKFEEKIPNGFKTIIPSTTKINDIKILNDTITVDLSFDDFEFNGDSFEKMLELIVYNLTMIKDIKKVYLKIDGKLIDKSPNGTIINQPLTRGDGINKIYNLINYKDVNLTTIYYTAKGNNNYYFIPVSKVSNDNRDKIKIIIDELTSKNTYETNLMSFLNYNTKLLNYELKDNILTLDFNEYIFDDDKNNNILEEVIYSISLSVKDNYDVDELVFKVNNKEITKIMIKNIE